MTSPQQPSPHWTTEELKAAVETYVEMLSLELAGQPYSKRAHAQKLLAGPLQRRTLAAVELRMQNISAVLEGLGETRIQGYLPARNVGPGPTQHILSFLAELHASVPNVLQTLPVPSEAPAGQRTPAKKQVVTMEYQRDAKVVAWVLARAQGRCERCLKAAPFMGKNGEPFLEVHHVEALANGGPDTPSNAVAICPNCHREAHYSAAAEAIAQELRAYLQGL